MSEPPPSHSPSRSFVQLHRGTIDVQSALGEGSTFTAHVPVDYRRAAAEN